MTARHYQLEAEADRILKEADDHQRTWLSHDQIELREVREIPVGLMPGGSHPGQYGKAWNPDINRRPTVKRLDRAGMDPWNQLLFEDFGLGLPFQSP